MTRRFVKTMVAAGVVAGVVFSTTGVVFPAGTSPSRARSIRAVAVFNQTVLIGQGLTPRAALHMAGHYVPYALTTAHYIPSGFQLTVVQVYPFVAQVQVPQDTQTFQNLTAPRTSNHHGRPAEAPAFEIDHQAARPYVYPPEAFYTLSTVKLGSRTAAVAEQKYTDRKHHRAIDLIYVYWYDPRRKVATEVTAELVSSRLSHAQIFKIAASIS